MLPLLSEDNPSIVGLVKTPKKPLVIAFQRESVLRRPDDLYRIKNLRCNDYRRLSWDMPVEFDPNFDLTMKSKQCNQMSRSKWINLPPIYMPRDENYFRSMNAIHFYHSCEKFNLHDIHGPRLRDQRRIRVLGDLYYCINHPEHYRDLRGQLNRVFETVDEVKYIERIVRLSLKQRLERAEQMGFARTPTLSLSGTSELVVSSPNIKMDEMIEPIETSTELIEFESIDLIERQGDDQKEGITSKRPSSKTGGGYSMVKMYENANQLLKDINVPSEKQNRAAFLPKIYSTNRMLLLSSDIESLNEESPSPVRPK